MTRKEAAELAYILHKRHAWFPKEGDKQTVKIVAADIYTQFVQKHLFAFTKRDFLAAVTEGTALKVNLKTTGESK